MNSGPGRDRPLTTLAAAVRRVMHVAASTVSDLRDAWRSGGTVGLAQEFREGVQFRLFQHGELLVIEHDLASVEHPPPPDGVEIRTLRFPAEWPALTTLGNRRTRDRLQRAGAAGRTCLVAWRGNRPVGYTWLSSEVAPEIEGFPIALPDDALYGWNLYVVPEERRAGIGSALTSARLRHARDRGYRVGWRAIDVENRGSVGTVRKTAGAGMRIAGRIRYLRMFGWWARSDFIPEPFRSTTLE